MQKNDFINKLKFLEESGVCDFMNDSPTNHYNNATKKIGLGDNSISTSSNNIGDIDNLKDLKKAVFNFNECDLKKTAKKTVFSDGNSDSNIMLIGEAPGADEDLKGLPFVGRAGQLLDKMLKSINLDRNKVYITNILPWRPPENRQPSTKEIISCLPFVQKHIELINPKILILLGGTAAKTLLMSDDGIMKLRGYWHEYNSYGLLNPIKTRALFHPAFLLRSPAYKKEAWEDLQEIKKNIENEK